MTKWQIQPSGVVAVLKKVNPYSTKLGESLNTLQPTVEAAVTATQSPAISQALQEYFQQEEGPRIQGMSTRIQASASGVVSATEFYVKGDLQMAADAQAASVAMVYPSPPMPGGSHIPKAI